MNESIYEKFAVYDNRNNKPIWNHPLWDTAELTDYIAAIINDTYHILGPNLPACVYQLKVHNELIKKGFQLQEKKSILHHCVENEPVRSLVVVNKLLVIDYISTDYATGCHRDKIRFDLQNNDYEMGLLINISERRNIIEIITVNKSYESH